MDWAQVLFLFFANASLIVWFRAESRADWRHMDNKLEAFKIEATAMIKAIQDEIKDFHGRLCSLEEKNKK